MLFRSDEAGDEDEGHQRFQEARAQACIDGGASTLSSRREVKSLSRAVYAMQPSANEQRPLKWSHVPITFDAEDHPDRTTGVGVLPLVVSPVIHNVTVTKMLVDGGAGLNLISTDLLEKLQIPRERLAPTGSFQGINVGATQPLGKIALPVTFGTRKNYRTENVEIGRAHV